MYATTPEQFASAGKAGFDQFFAAASTSFAGFEKLMELNIAASKAIFADVSQNARAAMEIKDAKELMALNASFAQPSVEKSISYGKQVYGIVTETQAALRKTAEVQSVEVQKEFAAMFEKSLKNAPAGSETAVAAVKSAVAAATSAYDNASKIAKQAFDMAEANLNNVAASAAENVKAAAKTAAKRK
jgi:phasin family protein